MKNPITKAKEEIERQIIVSGIKQLQKTESEKFTEWCKIKHSDIYDKIVDADNHNKYPKLLMVKIAKLYGEFNKDRGKESPFSRAKNGSLEDEHNC